MLAIVSPQQELLQLYLQAIQVAQRSRDGRAAGWALSITVLAGPVSGR